MAKAAFKNVSDATIGGKNPSERFLLPVGDDGVTPADLFWRRRVADGSVKHDPPESRTDQPKRPRVAKVAGSEAASDKGTV